MKEICGYLGKERFATRKNAANALATWAYRKGSRRITRRCAFCWGFHLTKGQRSRPMKG